MNEVVIPFDLARMFVGDLPLLFLMEIAVRSAIMYVATLSAIRMIGKRGMGDLSAFEFIVVIVLGSAAGDAMFYDDVPLLHALVVLITVVAIERLINWYTNTSRKAERRIEGIPQLLIKDGKVDLIALDKEGISMNELLTELRKEKVRYVEEVERMYIEHSGSMSVFTYGEHSKDKKLLTSTFPDAATPKK